MQFQEILDFINRFDQNRTESYAQNISHKEHILWQTIKVTEEVWEMNAQILGYMGWQRKEMTVSLIKRY